MKKRFDTGPDAADELSQQPIEQALQLALQRHQSGDLKQAQIIYQSILKAMPNEVNAMHFLGIAMHQSGNTKSGVELIERSIALDPQANRYGNLAKVLLETGRLEEASQAVNRALALDSTSADSLNVLGQLLIAQKRFEEAAAAFEKAIKLNPRHAEAYNNMGSLLEIQGRVNEAAPYYYKAITLMPPHMVTKKTLGSAHSSLGEMDKAAAVYRQWLAAEPNNPEARHLLAACTPAATPARATDAYVEYTFDAFADNFDEHLGRLDYRGPQLLADAMQRQYGEARKEFAVMDAGCGTGLCGPLVARYAASLTGVDLSARMLEKAKSRRTYDALIKAELTAYLQSQVDTFDIILSADTLIYFGALEDLLAGARSALRDGGHLFFTVEALTDDAGDQSARGYRLNPQGRYSHSETYLRRTLDAVGFTILAIEAAIIRHESAGAVPGFVVTCRASDVVA